MKKFLPKIKKMATIYIKHYVAWHMEPIDLMELIKHMGLMKFL